MSQAQSQTDISYNPLGTDGFEFVEYTAADKAGIDALKQLFSLLGFAEVAKHKSKEVWLYKQNDINFIVNAEPTSQAAEFARLRGPSVCGMAFRVKDASKAMSCASSSSKVLMSRLWFRYDSMLNGDSTSAVGSGSNVRSSISIV